jgi:hypothetical protein
MITGTYVRKPWNIPKAWEKLSSREQITTFLRMLNQFENGSYYVQDYFKERILIDLPTSPILCGYSKELAEKEGFDFFRRIMDEEHFYLRTYRDSEFFKLFHHLPCEHRKALVHLMVKNADAPYRCYITKAYRSVWTKTAICGSRFAAAPYRPLLPTTTMRLPSTSIRAKATSLSTAPASQRMLNL